MQVNAVPNQYGHRTMIGNWYEDQALHDHRVQEFLERKQRQEEDAKAAAAAKAADAAEAPAGTVLAGVSSLIPPAGVDIMFL